MNRRFRLTRSKDFDQVKQGGRSFSNRLFKVILRQTQEPSLRFGIITGKSIGNAVIRNRCKRQMRASLQQINGSLATGWDVVIITRRSAADADYQAILASLIELFRRSGLWIGSHADPQQ